MSKIIEKTLTAENQAIVEALRKQGSFVDDHGYKGDCLPPYIYLIYEDQDRDGQARQSICPTHWDSYFSINPLYMGEDGKAHLSRWSIGGVIDKDPSGQGRKRMPMAERCRAYNKGLEGADPRLGPFGQVTGLIYFSGPLRPKVVWL